MILNSKQSKLIELTMKLNLEAKKYKKICEKFEELKKKKESEKELLCLRELLKENQNRIVEINKQIKKM